MESPRATSWARVPSDEIRATFFEESWLEVFLLWVAVCLQRTCGKWGLLKQFVCDFSASSASSAVAFSAYIHHLF